MEEVGGRSGVLYGQALFVLGLLLAFGRLFPAEMTFGKLKRDLQVVCRLLKVASGALFIRLFDIG